MYIIIAKKNSSILLSYSPAYHNLPHVEYVAREKEKEREAEYRRKDRDTDCKRKIETYRMGKEREREREREREKERRWDEENLDDASVVLFH